MELFGGIENPLADLREPELAARPLVSDRARLDPENRRSFDLIQQSLKTRNHKP